MKPMIEKWADVIVDTMRFAANKTNMPWDNIAVDVLASYKQQAVDAVTALLEGLFQSQPVMRSESPPANRQEIVAAVDKAFAKKAA